MSYDKEKAERAPSGLAVLFGKRSPHDEAEEDEPSEEDLRGAHNDAFDAFFDAIHAKDKEGARAAWRAMNGEDSEEPDSEEEETEMPGEER